MVARRRWPDVRDFEKPAAYLYKVATHRTRRLHRSQRTELHGDLFETSGHLPSADDSLHVSPELDSTLGMLPRRQHEVILLRYIYRFKISEIAGILNISEGSVKNYLCLGRRRFAELLARDLDIEEGDGQ